MTYKNYTVEQYVKAMSHSFYDNFGFSEADAAAWFMKQPGARAVISTWGVTRDSLINTYIPALKTILNGGYMAFLIVTVTEGGGAGGWINHFATDAPGGGLVNLERDAHWIQDDLFVNPYPPATTDPYGRYYQPFVEDNPGRMESDYESLPDSAIGLYFIPATLAQNTWIWGEQWSIANHVYWGNPMNTFINIMRSAGIDPFSEPGTPPKPNPNRDPETGESGSPNEHNFPGLPGAELSGVIGDAVGKLSQHIMEAYENLLTKQLYDTYGGNSQLKINEYINIRKTFNNTYVLKQTPKIIKAIMDVIQSVSNTKDLGIPTSTPPSQDPVSPSQGNGTDKPDPNEPTPTQPNIAALIAKWAGARVGQSFDPDGYFGAQCVDLIAQVSIDLNLGLNTAGNCAKNIWNNPVPSNWHKVTANPASDADGIEKWNSVPIGSIVWFTNSGAGHVAIKASDTFCDVWNQNYGTDGSGGPNVRVNIGGWVTSGGAGVLGFWVPN